VAAAFLGVRLAVVDLHAWRSDPLATRLATSGPLLVRTIRHALLPHGLDVFYDVPVRTDPLEPVVLLSWGALLAGAGFLLAWSRRMPGLAFGAGWFTLAILPVSGLPGLLYPSLMADRYLYLPLIGAVIALAGGVSVAMRRIPSSLGRAGTVAGLVVLAWSASLTAGRLPSWRDSVTLWERARAAAPRNHWVLNELAVAYGLQGRLSESRQLLEDLYGLGDRTSRLFNNMARVHYLQGDLDQAEDLLRRALAFHPTDSTAMANLGEIHIRRGRPGPAAWVLGEALRHNPFNSKARHYLNFLLRDAPAAGPAG
jgi:hypothetical protein